MIWDDATFQRAYRARLGSVQASGAAEVRAQAMAYEAETARAGGSTGEYFTRRAGAAAAAILSGYVRGAIDAFDQTLAAVEAELAEADVNALRASLELEIARRAKALPAALRDFAKPAAPPALLRAILEQAPEKARQLLAERVAAARDRVRTRPSAREVPDGAIFVRHDARDAALADALRSAILATVGSDVALCTSSDLESLRTARDGFERMLIRLKKSRMMLALITPRSIDDPSLWWALGVAEGAGKPAFALRTAGATSDAALPLRAERVVDLAQQEDIVRLLRAIRNELRRRGEELSASDVEGVLREAAREHDTGVGSPCESP